MLAQGAYDILRQRLTLIDPTADLTHIAGLALCLDLGKAIGKLSDDARQVVLLYHGMGYEVPEIAEIGDISATSLMPY